MPGSFSWVSGRYLRVGKDNIATVTEEHVAARVGSRFSDVRDVIQVWLRRGESVELLDATRDGATASARRLVQDCPAGGRVSLDFKQVRQCELPSRRLAKDAGRHPPGRPAADVGRTV